MENRPVIRLFIASAAELKEEREKSIIFIHHLNNSHTHLDLEPVEWEYAMVRSNYPGYKSIQDAINPKLKESDLVVFLFYSKIGDNTLKEFKYAQAEKKRIFIFAKTGFTPGLETLRSYGKLLNFLDKLNNSILKIEYKDLTEFQLRLFQNLNQYLAENHPKIIDNSPTPKKKSKDSKEDKHDEVDERLNRIEKLLEKLGPALQVMTRSEVEESLKEQLAIRDNIIARQKQEQKELERLLSAEKGKSLAVKQSDGKRKLPVKVSVSNTDLYYSRYPIMVGHFLNDGITSTEKVIDDYCGNALSKRYDLNMYPGEIGSSDIIVNFKDEFKGAIVMGLGAPGQLSPFSLARTIEQATIKYMMELRLMAKGDERSFLPVEAGISVLLIGSGYGGLSIESSVRSIIKGIQNANIKIKELTPAGLNSIEQVEFVELYEDRYRQCLYVLNKIQTDEDRELDIQVSEKQVKRSTLEIPPYPLGIEEGWWNRTRIELRKEENGVLVLDFSVSTGGGREELVQRLASLDILDGFLEKISMNNHWNTEIAKTIFELLIPNELKDIIKIQANTMWVLDIASAAYPWEMLHDSPTNTKPLCCKNGMIRQLSVDSYLLRINVTASNRALIVGDPDLQGYPFASQLPAAFLEARLVASLLEKSGFEMPNNCFHKPATKIIQALFKDEYKIIHLSGHGIFNKKDPKASGVLIGNDILLTAREICQMSVLPELVFINCCFLGKVDNEAEELFADRIKLAANMGTTLIQNGVKVVVVAGWAVNDEASFHFTGIFYHELLGGSTFGDAIKAARVETFAKHPNTNTWGAYQCYGDPFYTIFRINKGKKVEDNKHKKKRIK